MVHRLDDFLAPLGVDAFFADHAGRKPAHLSGNQARVGLPDWPALAELLNMSALWSAETLSLIRNGEPVAAELYCVAATDRDLKPVQRPIAARMLALQADGAVLLARQVESLSPPLKRIASDLEAGFAARATADLHVHRMPAAAHAGARALADLWVLPLAGTVRARIAAGTIEHPVPHAKFAQAAPLPDAAAALLEARLIAGDRLYVPRGSIYAVDALSPDTAYVVVTVTRPIGLDLLQALVDSALDEPFFRRDLPRADSPDRAPYLAEFGRRLAALANQDVAARIEHALPRDLADYRLPDDGPADDGLKAAGGAVYRCSATRLEVVETPQGWQLRGARGAVPIPVGRERLVAWVIARPGFARAELEAAFPDTDPPMIEALLGELTAMKVIAPAA
jgi:hypothetical protein